MSASWGVSALGGVSAPAGGCVCSGGVCSRGGGMASQHALRQTPPHEQNDRQV